MSPSEKQTPAQYPRQIPFIIGNEACERFSFYGMRNILTQFLVSSALLGVLFNMQEREAAAKEIFHIFVIGVYFFPLVGGWLSDRYFGKYRTILWLSLVYCLGNACLALFTDSKAGFYTGLFLIAVGSGGIKPCVSAFVGEQFDQTNKHLAKIVFDAFYWIINFGSFFASLLIPLTLQAWGPRVAFGVPGILMFVATVIFWLGRNRYVVEPPQPGDPHSFTQVMRSALLAEGPGGRPGLRLFWVGVILGSATLGLACLDAIRQFVLHQPPYLGLVTDLCLAMVLFMAFGGLGAWKQLDRARGLHPDADVDGARSVLRVLVFFALVTPFWSLFDQKASTWVLQGRVMNLPGWSWFQSASQMQSLNPLLVMILIPVNNLFFFPMLRRFGFDPTPLRKMASGIVLAGISWIAIGILQTRLDAGQSLSILWQMIPYLFLTAGEVLVSATGLEFAYSQAPPKLKGVLMSFWTLSVTVGNLWVLLVNATVRGESATRLIQDFGFQPAAFQMFFFAFFALAAALVFALFARSYVMVDYYRKA